jgi:archaeal flagellin FlaB
MSKSNKFAKNDAGFTGLEAAIVLIAFVVVAAVFSYVMLGAGFFTSEKSKEVVHTGMDTATTSVQLVGDVIGAGESDQLTSINVTISTAAGNSPVDLNKTTISLKTSNFYSGSVWSYTDADSLTWISTNQEDGNNLLEQYEKAQIQITIPSGCSIGVNDKFQFTITPPQGAPLTVYGTVPPAIDPIMVLG